MNIKNDNLKNLLFITIVWFFVYCFCQVILEQKLGWDEINYLSVARGIAENFDYSARSYTVMGLLKHGFPTHSINYPVSSFYIALFFKLFGASLKVAYFSTWLAGLGVCILIYFIFNLFSENKKLSVLVSLSYLLYPGFIRNFDSAMMEQLGNCLLCLFTYLIFKDYIKGLFDWRTLLKIVFMCLILWIYKTLFVGIFYGILSFIFLSSKDLVGEKVTFKIHPILFTLLNFAIFAGLLFICMKWIFLPVAPMMNFTIDKEYSQVYSDFLAGYFNDFPNSFLTNVVNSFYILKTFFIYPSHYVEPQSHFFIFIPYIVLISFYFLVLIFSILFLFLVWHLLKPEEKTFIVFTITSILGFNVTFFTIFITTYENMWRYNLYYLPLYLITIGIVLKSLNTYFDNFYQRNKIFSYLFVLVFIVFIYTPLTFSAMKMQKISYDYYHNQAKMNGMLVSKVLEKYPSRFIYLNDGSHTAFTSFPTIQIMKDATNEQLLQINKILPEPIGFLFLKQSDWLAVNNKEQILKSEPILNNSYVYYSYEPTTNTVIYRYRG